MTEQYAFDGSQTELGSRAAVVVAAFAAGLLGVSAGYPLQTLLGIAGGVVFGVAARDLSAEALRDRVRGSSLLLVASVLVVTALALQKASLADAVVVVAVPLAVGTTTLGAFVAPSDAGTAVFAALGRSFVATVVGTLLAAALYANVFVGTVSAAWTAFSASLGVTPFFGFVALQFEFLLVGILASKAGRAAAELDPERDPSTVDTVGFLDVPRAVWALLAVQLLALPFPGGPGLFEYALSIAGPVGSLAAIALSSVYLHGALAVFIGVLLVLPVVSFVRSKAVDVVGGRPPRSLAFATGGIGFAALVIALTSIPGVSALVRWLVEDNTVASAVFDAYGVGPAVLGAVSGVLVVIAFCLVLYGTAMTFPFVPSEASAFVFGGFALFVAACAGAFANAPAPAVFVAMAGAMVTWDFGQFSMRLGEELGRAADTRTVEVVHGLGTLSVGAIGVGLAAFATHFFVPAMTGLSKTRALTALGLLTIAVVAFAYLVDTATDDDEEPNRHDDAGR